MKKYITALIAEDSENDTAMASTNKRHRKKSPTKPPAKKQRKETKKSPAARKYNYKEVCVHVNAHNILFLLLTYMLYILAR